jgi:hypothetical protein
MFSLHIGREGGMWLSRLCICVMVLSNHNFCLYVFITHNYIMFSIPSIEVLQKMIPIPSSFGLDACSAPLHSTNRFLLVVAQSSLPKTYAAIFLVYQSIFIHMAFASASTPNAPLIISPYKSFSFSFQILPSCPCILNLIVYFLLFS